MDVERSVQVLNTFTPLFLEMHCGVCAVYSQFGWKTTESLTDWLNLDFIRGYASNTYTRKHVQHTFVVCVHTSVYVIDRMVRIRA